jgi:hypothetical protein
MYQNIRIIFPFLPVLDQIIPSYYTEHSGTKRLKKVAFHLSKSLFSGQIWSLFTNWRFVVFSERFLKYVGTRDKNVENVLLWSTRKEH